MQFNSRGWVLFSVIVLLLAASTARSQEPPQKVELYQQTEVHMGSKVTIALYAPSESQAHEGFRQAFQRIHELDLVMSDYRDESELNRLSASSPSSSPIPVSQDLWPVLVKADEISRLTEGAFDISVGPLTILWRRAKRTKELPTEETLRVARGRVGYEKILLDSEHRTARLTVAAMRLDLGGIGQGYAADEALAVLRKLGLPRAIVNVSGDIAVGESPPQERGWKVAFPGLNKQGQSALHTQEIAEQAMSTSGDAFQFVEINGQRYSHIVDPSTGLGFTESRSVTILAENCMLADSLATALSILPAEKGLAVADKLSIAAQIISQTPKGVLMVHSKRWKEDALPGDYR